MLRKIDINDPKCIDSFQLIAEIKKYEFLYNKEHKDYNTKRARAPVWAKISKALFSNFDTLDERTRKTIITMIHRRWKHLRDSLGRILRIRHQQPNKKETTSEQAKAMAFMIPYMKYGFDYCQNSSSSYDENNENNIITPHHQSHAQESFDNEAPNLTSLADNSFDENSINEESYEHFEEKANALADANRDATSSAVEELPFDSFTVIDCWGEQNPAQNPDNIREHTSLTTEPACDELLTVAKVEELTKEPSANTVDLTMEEDEIDCKPETSEDNNDCISIKSDCEERHLSKNTMHSERETDKSKTSKRLRDETDLPSTSKGTAPDYQSTSNAAKKFRSDNEVLVDLDVFDLLKKNSMVSEDEDRMYLLSILSDFKKILPQNKLKVKMQIVQAIVDGL